MESIDDHVEDHAMPEEKRMLKDSENIYEILV
jgi:hypothetical protein